VSPLEFSPSLHYSDLVSILYSISTIATNLLQWNLAPNILTLTTTPSVFWYCWLDGRKSIWPVKKLQWGGAGVVICLKRGANDLHMVQLLPLPPCHLCFRKSRMVYPSGTGLPGLSWKKAVKWQYSRWTVTVLVAGRGPDNCFMSCNRSTYVLTARGWRLFSCDACLTELVTVSHNNHQL